MSFGTRFDNTVDSVDCIVKVRLGVGEWCGSCGSVVCADPCSDVFLEFDNYTVALTATPMQTIVDHACYESSLL